jgi:asparagine synthase (glutamine-hydrolysing)
MFAFAIWDDRSEELYLVRDRMGVKPLYWYPTPDGALFGSETPWPLPVAASAAENRCGVG